ncbi:MAG TPA: branched-chain amino acid ABC transporter permease [Geminicoccaceae bacterium]|nr:branched-chain amino acid ABC transporter permease [Geminicoccaceae bacterium]
MAELGPFLEVLLGGLMTGVLYALVALGFVLIFKASGVFNFAQGAMVLFAALSLVRLMGWVPLPLAILLTVAIMIAVAFVIERVVLRPLVGQHALILFMATIGIAFVLDGFGQTVWGSNVYTLNLGIPASPWFILEGVFPGGILLSPIDVFATVVAGALVAALSVFFHGTKIGRALRAVADDHQAAQSVGIPLNQIWLIVWSAAGIVSLVAGMAWGSKLGVQFSIAAVALKALPVLILGGLTSIPGAIVGGLMIGAGEKLAEVYLGPSLGGGIENWFAYVVALVVLLFRPQGLFGERIIERI